MLGVLSLYPVRIQSVAHTYFLSVPGLSTLTGNIAPQLDPHRWISHFKTMAQTPSPPHRPNLHLSLTPLLGNPNQTYHQSPPGHTPYSTSQVNPFVATPYSPFRSAGLKPPTPYGGSVQFSPRSKESSLAYGSYAWFRFRRFCTSRMSVPIVVFLGLLWWWRAGLSNDLNLVKLGVHDFSLGTQILGAEDTKNLQFFSAVNPKIHVSHLRSPFV